MLKINERHYSNSKNSKSWSKPYQRWYKSNAYSEIIHEKKPKWIRISANQNNKEFELIKERTKNLKLSTVCEEAKCPNLSECWSM